MNNFRDTGSWPTGTHPFGYGKACHDAGGKLLWAWQPVSRSRGQVFTPGPREMLTPGPADVKLPRKEKHHRTTLVPSNNPDYIRAVRLVFDLYVRVGMSRRQISARLNGKGLRFYSREWTHPLVTHVLRNPAYIGDTHFGKTQAGTIHTFDGKGLVVEVARAEGVRRRDVAEQIVQKGTHTPLIDPKTWELAQEKLAGEQDAAREGRKSFSPRNPAYYLKQLFVCGHCGKPMRGRTEIDGKTRKRTIMYACSSYIQGRCGGYETPCGYHRIAHT